MEREHPWHLRRATAKHEQWLRNLADLHELTTGWLMDLRSDRPAHLMTRGFDPEIAENLWMLESLSEKPIVELLDDTRPEDMLSRLERTIWAVQAWTYASLAERASDRREPGGERAEGTQAAVLSSVLEQSSWKSGRRCGERRWPGAEAWGEDLRAVLAAIVDSPFNGRPEGEGFLVRRALRDEVRIELKCCPHRSTHPEVLAVADELCRLQTQWLRGFLYSIHARIAVESRRPDGARCQLRWTFLGP